MKTQGEAATVAAVRLAERLSNWNSDAARLKIKRLRRQV